MSTASAALKDLTPDAAKRVIHWLGQHYHVKPATNSYEARSTESFTVQFAEIPDLFDAAKPDNGIENVLVAAYWFQAIQKQNELDSQQINSALKHLGYQSSNITRDLDSLMDRSPKLIIQVRKDGNTRQARKRYRLTTEGIRSVEKMLKRPVAGNDDEVFDRAA
jgi:hypothetical protein